MPQTSFVVPSGRSLPSDRAEVLVELALSLRRVRGSNDSGPSHKIAALTFTAPKLWHAHTAEPETPAALGPRGNGQSDFSVGVGTSTSPPSTAVVTGTSTSVLRLSPSRSKRRSGLTVTIRLTSPAAPPLRPGPP